MLCNMHESWLIVVRKEHESIIHESENYGHLFLGKHTNNFCIADALSLDSILKVKKVSFLTIVYLHFSPLLFV